MVSEKMRQNSILIGVSKSRVILLQALYLRLCDAGRPVPDVFIAERLNHLRERGSEEAPVQPRDQLPVYPKQNDN